MQVCRYVDRRDLWKTLTQDFFWGRGCGRFKKRRMDEWMNE